MALREYVKIFIKYLRNTLIYNLSKLLSKQNLRYYSFTCQHLSM